MATLEEIYAKAMSDDAEKKAFAEALSTREGAAAYLAQHDCEATPEELVALLKGKAGASGELSDETLEGATGGGWGDWVVSIAFVGVGCAIEAIISVVANSDAVSKYDNPYAPKHDDNALEICS